MAEFADAYPSLGLCELIGVPIADRDRFRGWANTIGLGFSPVELAERIAEVDAALIALVDYTGELAELRRQDPRDDLVTRIAQAAARGRLEHRRGARLHRRPGVRGPRDDEESARLDGGRRWPTVPTSGTPWRRAPRASPTSSRRCCACAPR